MPSDACVLVVDDDEPSVDLLKLYLEALGFRHESAMSGEEALERIQADPDSVGMVLLDLAMPAMNGYEVCRVLRRNPRLAGIPVVALTANVEGGLQEKVDEAGFNGLITKPYSRKDLQAALKAHFRPA